MTFLSIDHPAIACTDVMRQAEWYCRHLGMRVIANNGKEPPAVMVGEGGKADLIRKRDTYEDLLANDVW